MGVVTVPASAETAGALFVMALPKINRIARYVLRRIPGHRKDEAIADAASLAWLYFVRVQQRGKNPLRFLTVLARFAAVHVGAGRSVHSCRSRRDLLAQSEAGGSSSPSSRAAATIPKRQPAWKLFAVEDHTATPADTAAFRIDFEEWTKRLPTRDRKIVMELASGAKTSEVAKQFEISAGRVSQLRAELQKSWERYQGIAVA